MVLLSPIDSPFRGASAIEASPAVVLAFISTAADVDETPSGKSTTGIGEDKGDAAAAAADGAVGLAPWFDEA